jgi:hypothetical protein
LFRVGRGKKEGKKKKEGRAEVRTEGKCLEGRARALYRAVEQKGTNDKKEMSAKDGSRCLLMFGGSIPAHLDGSYSLFQPSDAGRLEGFSATGTHPQRAPATAPVLAFVVCVANCAFDWRVGIARW